MLLNHRETAPDKCIIIIIIIIFNIIITIIKILHTSLHRFGWLPIGRICSNIKTVHLRDFKHVPEICKPLEWPYDCYQHSGLLLKSRLLEKVACKKIVSILNYANLNKWENYYFSVSG